MIQIQRSLTADSRSCDVTKVTEEKLLESSLQHIGDVQKGMDFFIQKLVEARRDHDFTKLLYIGEFHSDFKTEFKQHSWYDKHKAEERHHINAPDGVRDDVNVIDLIEYIVDGTMAGRARTGKVFPFELSNELLQKIVKNTADLINSQIVVTE
jgi:hypothetical protein